MFMKKAIYLTIGSVLMTSAIVATSILLPTLTTSSNVNSFKLFNYNPNNLANLDNSQLRFNPTNMSSINQNYKDIISGKFYKDNNYVLLITSQGYNSNNTFLYGSQDQIDSKVSETNSQPILNGDFGKGLKSIPDLQIQPKVLVIQDVLTKADYSDEEAYNNMVQEYKNIDTSAADNDENSDDYKKKHWAQSADPFSFEPGKPYKTWDGKTVYFRQSNKFPLLYKEIVSFVKSNFNNLSDVTTSSSIVIGYKDGNLCSDFTGSFSSSTGDEEGSDSNGASQTNFYSSYNNSKSISTFEQWLTDNYGTKE